MSQKTRFTHAIAQPDGRFGCHDDFAAMMPASAREPEAPESAVLSCIPILRQRAHKRAGGFYFPYRAYMHRH